MALSDQDRIDITDLINLHGHLVDAGKLDEAGQLFTPDVTYDVEDLGGGSLRGTAAIRDAALALGRANPVGHHATNIVITPIDERSAQVRSKGIGIRADGTAGSVVYEDTVTHQTDGWRISYRTVTGRRAALGDHQAGAREVLERLRRAAVHQSADDMSRLYAVDAVHEFPFSAPGVPSRLEGRDAIVNWIAAGWKAGQLKYERYRTLAIHDTSDPETIVVEQEALGSSESTGEFALPNIVVLTVRNGQIAHLRDYVNILEAAAAMERDMKTPSRGTDHSHRRAIPYGTSASSYRNRANVAVAGSSCGTSSEVEAVAHQAVAYGPEDVLAPVPEQGF